jgi:general secretion pathway protein D
MKSSHKRSGCVPWLVTLFIACLLVGCTGMQAYREGQSRISVGDTEAGLAKLREAMAQDPQNTDYRRVYFSQREAALNAAVREAEAALDVGAFPLARQAYERAGRIDPANERVVASQDRVAAVERQWKALDEAMALARAGNIDAAVSKTQQAVSENPASRRGLAQLRQLMRQQADASGKELGIYPKLKAAYRVPVTLSFTNATILQVFEALKQASGLNYMLDRDVKPDIRVTISVKNKPVEDILRLLLATNQLERRVLDDDTLLIYPNTAAKATEYKEMVVRSFYLSNADATKVAGVVRTISKARDVVVDEKLNMLVVRDSAEVIRLVEKLVAAQDLAEPEVMLELEVMEVGVNRLLDMGIHWPDTVSATVAGAAGTNGQLTLDELRHRTASMVQLTTNDPLISAQLRSQVGDSNLLANPRVRVRNKETAKVLIGERVPVITTTATANVGTSESVNYLDVGLKLEIEPTISLDDEVSMKVALEVSNIIATITTPSGTQVYRLGTRNTSTTLRVRDGETNILAGLIERDRSHSNTGIPGLNELPIANRLFGATEDSDTRTEIVLLITPHVIHNLDVPGVGQQEFLSGTDSSVGGAPIQLGTPGPATQQGQGAPARPPAQRPTAPAPGVPSTYPPSAQPSQPSPQVPVIPAQAPPQNSPAVVPQTIVIPQAASAVPPPFTAPPLIPETPGK